MRAFAVSACGSTSRHTYELRSFLFVIIGKDGSGLGARHLSPRPLAHTCENNRDEEGQEPCCRNLLYSYLHTSSALLCGWRLKAGRHSNAWETHKHAARFRNSRARCSDLERQVLEDVRLADLRPPHVPRVQRELAVVAGCGARGKQPQSAKEEGSAVYENLAVASLSRHEVFIRPERPALERARAHFQHLAVAVRVRLPKMRVACWGVPSKSALVGRARRQT